MWGVDVCLHTFLNPEPYGGERTAFCLKLMKAKRQSNPITAWTGPEVSSSLRLPDFMIFGT